MLYKHFTQQMLYTYSPGTEPTIPIGLNKLNTLFFWAKVLLLITAPFQVLKSLQPTSDIGLATKQNTFQQPVMNQIH